MNENLKAYRAKTAEYNTQVEKRKENNKTIRGTEQKGKVGKKFLNFVSNSERLLEMYCLMLEIYVSFLVPS